MSQDDDKSYTMDDLAEVMKEREYFKGKLETSQREIAVENGKLRSLEKDEADHALRLNECESKIRRILKNLG